MSISLQEEKYQKIQASLMKNCATMKREEDLSLWIAKLKRNLLNHQITEDRDTGYLLSNSLIEKYITEEESDQKIYSIVKRYQLRENDAVSLLQILVDTTKKPIASKIDATKWEGLRQEEGEDLTKYSTRVMHVAERLKLPEGLILSKIQATLSLHYEKLYRGDRGAQQCGVLTDWLDICDQWNLSNPVPIKQEKDPD